jgi:hypothetical protein
LKASKAANESKIESLKNAHRAQIMELNASLNVKLEAMKQEQDEVVSSLRQAHKSMMNEASAEFQAKLKETNELHAASLSHQKTMHMKVVEEIQAVHEQRAEHQVKQYKIQIERLQSEYTELQSNTGSIRSKVLEELKQEHAKALADAQLNWNKLAVADKETAVQTVLISAKQEKEVALREMENKFNDEKRALIAQKDLEAQQMVLSAKSQSNIELQNDISHVVRTKDQKTNELLDRQRADFDNEKKLLLAEWKQEKEQSLEHMKSRCLADQQAAIRVLQEQHDKAIQDLKNEHTNVLLKSKAEYKTLHDDYQSLSDDHRKALDAYRKLSDDLQVAQSQLKNINEIHAEQMKVQVQMLNEQHAEVMANTIASHGEKVMNLHREIDQLQTNSFNKQDQAMEQLRQMWEAEKKLITDRLISALEQVKQHQLSISQMKESHQKARETLLAEADAEFQSTLEAERNLWNLDKHRFEGKIHACNETIKNLQLNIRELQLKQQSEREALLTSAGLETEKAVAEAEQIWQLDRQQLLLKQQSLSETIKGLQQNILSLKRTHMEDNDLIIKSAQKELNEAFDQERQLWADTNANHKAKVVSLQQTIKDMQNLIASNNQQHAADTEKLFKQAESEKQKAIVVALEQATEEKLSLELKLKSEADVVQTLQQTISELKETHEQAMEALRISSKSELDRQLGEGIATCEAEIRELTSELQSCNETIKALQLNIRDMQLKHQSEKEALLASTETQLKSAASIAQSELEQQLTEQKTTLTNAFNLELNAQKQAIKELQLSMYESQQKFAADKQVMVVTSLLEKAKLDELKHWDEDKVKVEAEMEQVRQHANQVQKQSDELLARFAKEKQFILSTAVAEQNRALAEERKLSLAREKQAIDALRVQLKVELRDEVKTELQQEMQQSLRDELLMSVKEEVDEQRRAELEALRKELNDQHEIDVRNIKMEAMALLEHQQFQY